MIKFGERAEYSACEQSKQKESDEKGYFTCEFVEKPPKAVQAECPVCLQILYEPYQVSCCGYSFCKTCIEQIQANKKQCPTCNEKIFTTFHNKGLQRSLYEFHVYCTHKQQGCEWTGELGQLDKHLNLISPLDPDKCLEGCQYIKLECRFCHDLIQRHTITTHQADLCPKRPFSCEYCHNYQSVYDDVIHNHWPVCGFHPVPCPNECGTFPQRQNLQTHINNECPLTVIDCDFHHVGCDVKLPRKDMPTHLKENLVTHMSLHIVSYGKLLETVTRLQASHERILMKLETENDTLKDQLKKVQTENKQLQHKLVAQRDYSQTKELDEKQHELLRKGIQDLSISVFSERSVPYISTPTLDEDSVELSMSSYEQRKKDNNTWYSPPFHTHPQGYKMCIRVHANGCGKAEGTHVSVFINLMRGAFDGKLRWPFRGDITIQLVDQERDEEHHSKTVAFNDYTPAAIACRVVDTERQRESWGFHKFISHDDLGPCYLKNDSLCFRITKSHLY